MIIVGLVVLAVCFALGAVFGAPYLPILTKDSQRLLDLADMKAGQTLLDLGCGDAKLLRAAARRGIKGIGYEINPLVFIVAWLSCLRYRKLVKIRLANFWLVSWPPADVIYVFLIERYMPKLDCQLQARIKHPVQVVSYVFQIPGRQAVRSTNNAWVYSYPNSEN